MILKNYKSIKEIIKLLEDDNLSKIDREHYELLLSLKIHNLFGRTKGTMQ